LPPDDRLPGELDPRVPKDYLTRNLLGEYSFQRGLALAPVDRARALELFERAATTAFDNDVLQYNVGLAYERLGLLAQALVRFERAQAINPRPIPGPSRALASARIEALRRRAAGASDSSP
jgi:tetratricopeptide (TPR) repeat protein